MTTISFPSLVPKASEWGLRSNSQAFTSPLSGSVQTVELAGARWYATLDFSNLHGTDARVFKAFLAQLRGMAGRFTLHDHSGGKPRGVASGTALARNRSNLIPYSNDLAAWIDDGTSTVTEDAITDPDGGSTGNLLVFDAAANAHLKVPTEPATLNGTFTFSIWLKAPSATDINVQFLTTPGIQYDSGDTTWSVTTAWQRFTKTFTVSGVTTDTTLYAYLVKRDTSARTLHAFHGQLDVGSHAGPPLTTAGAGVESEAQSGGTLYADNLSASVADWLMVGDYLGVNGELKVVTADVDSDAYGNVSIPIEPPLRNVPAEGTTIITLNPTCTMMLVDDAQARWNNAPGDFHSSVIECVEAF